MHVLTHLGTRGDSHVWTWSIHTLLRCLLIWCGHLWANIRPASLLQYAWKGLGKCKLGVVGMESEACVCVYVCSVCWLVAQVVYYSILSLSLSLSLPFAYMTHRYCSWWAKVFFVLIPLMQGKILQRLSSNCLSNAVISTRKNDLCFLRWGWSRNSIFCEASINCHLMIWSVG